MNEGWIKIYYKIKDWEWYGDPNMVALWLHLLISANWKDKKWHGVDIKRGQFVTSVTKLSEATGLTTRQTRVCLERLEESKQIVKQTTSHYTIITICNYDNYQDCEQTECQTNDKQNVTPMANQWQADDKQNVTPMATTEEYKEGNKLIHQDPKNLSTHTHYAREGEKIGIFKNVILSDSDLETIRMNFATEGLDDTFLNRCVDKLSSYMAQNGTHYTNHAAAILSWVKAAVLEEDRRTGKAQPKPAAYSSKTVSPEAEHERKVRELKQLWDAMSDEDKRITIELEGMPMYENPKYIERQ